jgi:hypothetical protein
MAMMKSLLKALSNATTLELIAEPGVVCYHLSNLVMSLLPHAICYYHIIIKFISKQGPFVVIITMHLSQLIICFGGM